MRAIVVRRHTPFAPVILAHQHTIDVDRGTPLRLRIRYAWRLHDLYKTVHAGGGAQTSSRQSRSQNDKNERIVQEGFETPAMNCAKEGRREHS